MRVYIARRTCAYTKQYPVRTKIARTGLFYAVSKAVLAEILRFHAHNTPFDINPARRRAVGSIKVVADAEKKEKQEALWATLHEGDKITGTVKSLTSYGAFVDLGGIDGMVHISELSWSRIKHPSEVVKVGDTVEVTIKALDEETKKISLGFKNIEDNPWEILKNKYPVGSVVDAKIVSFATFGAFANILPTIDGLIHISQISWDRIKAPLVFFL